MWTQDAEAAPQQRPRVVHVLDHLEGGDDVERALGEQLVQLLDDRHKCVDAPPVAQVLDHCGQEVEAMHLVPQPAERLETLAHAAADVQQARAGPRRPHHLAHGPVLGRYCGWKKSLSSSAGDHSLSLPPPPTPGWKL